MTAVYGLHRTCALVFSLNLELEPKLIPRIPAAHTGRRLVVVPMCRSVELPTVESAICEYFLTRSGSMRCTTRHRAQAVRSGFYVRVVRGHGVAGIERRGSVSAPMLRQSPVTRLDTWEKRVGPLEERRDMFGVRANRGMGHDQLGSDLLVRQSAG